MRKIGAALDEARDILSRAYFFAERDMTNREFSVRDETYRSIRHSFSYIAKRLKKRNIHTEPLHV